MGSSYTNQTQATMIQRHNIGTVPTEFAGLMCGVSASPLQAICGNVNQLLSHYLHSARQLVVHCQRRTAVKPYMCCRIPVGMLIIYPYIASTEPLLRLINGAESPYEC
jgi:hypothetical protein